MKTHIIGAIILCLVCTATGCGSRTTDTIKVSRSESSASVTKPSSEIPASTLDISSQKHELETSSQELTVSTSEDENILKKSTVQVSDDKDIWQEPSDELSDEEDIWQEPSDEPSDEEDIWHEPSDEPSDEEDIWQEPSDEPSDEEDIWQEPSDEPSDEEDIWQEPFDESSDEEDLAKPEDTKFAYGICKQNCYVEVANGESYPLYKGQQVTICYINDATYEIMWYPETGIVPKDNIEVYPDDFVPDFNRGQWAGTISKTQEENSQILTYGICNKTCTIKVDQGPTQELYKGQQIGIVAYRDDLAQILWYDTSAFVPIECIEFYPESFQPDFSRGQWAGVITN